jgi:hypothetical protein
LICQILILDTRFVEGQSQYSYSIHYNWGDTTQVYTNCTFTGMVGSTSCPGGLLFKPNDYYYGQELIVRNSTITNITVGGSSNGISSGLFYLYMPSSDWFIFEV